jgi:cytochrome c556
VIKRLFILIGIPVLVGLTLSGFEPLMAQSDEAIKVAQEERKQRFKASSASMKALYREYLPAEDYQAIKAEATVLVKWAIDMPEAFPFGSDSNNDEAKPEIWTDFEGFKSAAKVFETASLDLQTAAEQNDISLVKTALGSVGASCKACHQKYRKK